MATFSTLWTKGESLPLLIALGALFVLESLATGPSPLIGLAYVAVLLGSALAMKDRRLLMRTLGLLAAAVMARIVYEVSPGRLTLLINHLGAIVFLAYAALFIFKRAVAAPGRVGRDRIVGAISVYLMMGVIGAAIASSIEAIQTGAFRFPDGTDAAVGPYLAGDTSAFIYFSFVTLATLGYGDIIPVTPLARTFSWMLAVTGQMYVAIVVARLVSLGFAQPSSREHGNQ
ncbi:MAG: ion channel [Candidatus Polarisedimenticolia bacterium]